MKKILFMLPSLLMGFTVFAQPKTDSLAVIIFDQMSHIIGDLNSVDFTVETRNDVIDPFFGPVSNFSVNQVVFDGPDKMYVNLNGDKGHRSYWYNGEFLVYYSFNENNFAIIETPPTTIETIDSINLNYGVDFPAADFFYPSFTEDLIAASTELIYTGKNIVEAKECFHIVSKQKDMTVQFWIENSVLFLPVKMLIMYKSENQDLQYEATFKEWKINPELPVSMFNFLPPPGAREIKIQAKTKK
jgi:hypothetical protein